MTTFAQIKAASAQASVTTQFKLSTLVNQGDAKLSTVIHMEPRRMSGGVGYIDSGAAFRPTATTVAGARVNRNARAVITGAVQTYAYPAKSTTVPNGNNQIELATSIAYLLVGAQPSAITAMIASLPAAALAEILYSIPKSVLEQAGLGGLSVVSADYLSSLPAEYLIKAVATLMSSPAAVSAQASIALALVSASPQTLATIIANAPLETLITLPPATLSSSLSSLFAGMTEQAITTSLVSYTVEQLVPILSSILALDPAGEYYGYTNEQLAELTQSQLAAEIARITKAVPTNTPSAMSSSLSNLFAGMTEQAITTSLGSYTVGQLVPILSSILSLDPAGAYYGYTNEQLATLTSSQLAAEIARITKTVPTNTLSTALAGAGSTALVVVISGIDPAGPYYGYTGAQLASLTPEQLATEAARIGETALSTALAGAGSTAIATIISGLEYSALTTEANNVEIAAVMLIGSASDYDYGTADGYLFVPAVSAAWGDPYGFRYVEVPAIFRLYDNPANMSATTRDTIEVTGDIGPYIVIPVTISESVTIGIVVSKTAVMSVTVADTVTFATVTQEDGSVEVWVVNAANSASSRYEGFNFNSIAQSDDGVYAASDSGIYRLSHDEATDHGWPINASVLTGNTDYGVSQKKRVSYVYVGADAADGITVEVNTDEGQTEEVTTVVNSSLDMVRADVGKGLRGRYYQVRLSNVDGGAVTISDMSVEYDQLNRRI